MQMNSGVLSNSGKWTLPISISSRQYKLPIRVILSGFVVDSVLFALLLWLIYFGCSTPRRWRRAKRGLCLKCAYPIGTSDTCTECGRPVTGRAQNAQ
jgi:hypothetical protein